MLVQLVQQQHYFSAAAPAARVLQVISVEDVDREHEPVRLSAVLSNFGHAGDTH